ncbi:extracellular solute-binding protein [Paenibacillus arenilitoris]|uniref:Extracellular solute-binding protein n=1 Tax=Paenibacillus arenilitoris TaxID=2772299 RepID=A0A927CLC1_9BACL|nr:extracellular solute-binding protein [Paenibacillus arenilitoris]MBD2868912.1 extracellular solute-binding protein [Paenibacillus arenilitoris]
MPRGRLIALICMLFLAAGCGGQSIISDESSVARLNQNEKVEIEFWHTYSDEETRILEDQILPAFEKAHPDIRVRPVRQYNNAELKYTLISKASANRSPDVVRMDIAWVSEFAQSGLLLPLSDNDDFDDVTKSLQSNTGSAGYFAGAHYSLPVNMNTKVAIFSRELLEKSGLSKPPAAFQEVIELARKEGYKIGMSGLEAWKSLPYVYALGGRMTDEAYTRATGYLNGEGTVKAVELLLSLYKERLIDGAVINGGADLWEDVKTGKLLVMDDGPWFYSVFQGEELERAVRSTVAVPFFPAFGPASILGGEDLVIPRGSKYPKQAWAFMKWMIGKDAQVAMSRTGLIPTNVEAKEMKARGESFIPPFTEALEHTFLRPPVKEWSAMDKIYTGYMTQIFQGKLSAKDGLTKAAAEIDLLLAG